MITKPLKYICIGFLTLILINTKLSAQRYFTYNWKDAPPSKARYAVFPPSDSSNRYVVKRLGPKKEPVITGFFVAKEMGNLNTGELVLFNTKGDSLELINFIDGKKNGLSIKWFDSGELYGRQNFLEDKEDGICEWFFKSGQISAKYVMSMGEIKEQYFWNEDGSVENDIEGANQKPRFIGGDAGFNRYISEKLVYPVRCRNNGIVGTVYLSFLVNPDGTITEVEVIKSVHPDLDNEALRVLKLAPKWRPGKVHNQLVKVRIIFPVTFQLRGR